MLFDLYERKKYYVPNLGEKCMFRLLGSPIYDAECILGLKFIEVVTRNRIRICLNVFHKTKLKNADESLFDTSINGYNNV